MTTDTITLTQVYPERKPNLTTMAELPPIPMFPQYSFYLDVDDVMIVTNLAEKYKRQNDLSVERVQEMFGAILRYPVDKWEIERDVALRETEIIGVIHLLKEPGG